MNLTEGLYTALTNVNFDAGDLINMGLKAGEANIKVMKLLKQAHIDHYGEPEPAEVSRSSTRSWNISYRS